MDVGQRKSSASMPVYVGLDWADDHRSGELAHGLPNHDVYVTNEQAEKLAAFRVAHTVDGLAALRQRLREVSAEPEALRIAIERPDGLLVASLLDWGYAVYPINPKAVDRYRDRHQTSGAKHPLPWVPAPGTPWSWPISCAPTATATGGWRGRARSSWSCG
jgi:hypothetical protein